MNFVEELRWRGMIHDIMPETEKFLSENKVSGYIGFDPTSDSLHIGSLVQIMILVHFQKHGHTPYVLVGGATGMVGDPSGKSKERNLLEKDELFHNVEAIQKQLAKFLEFEHVPNAAAMVNNYDWFKSFNFLDFIRDVGKHISVNYMMAKESVKKRLETGISFTEFTYQLVQGYDFYWLYKNHQCKVQMGGSDQWGNILSGVDLIRKINKKDAFGITSPLITNADGSKMGKTVDGAVWLNKEKISSLDFFQFWRNVDDKDVPKFLNLFTKLPLNEIKKLSLLKDKEINEAKKILAYEITKIVRGKDEANEAIEMANNIFNSNIADERLPTIIEKKFDLKNNTFSILDAIEKLDLVKSRSEIKRLIKSDGIKVNDRIYKNSNLSLNEFSDLNEIKITIGKKKNGILKII